jgi:putative transposase
MSYPSALEAAHWQQMAHHFEPRDRRGSGHKRSQEQIVKGILYVVRTGCQWRPLPKDCRPWKTVYEHFRTWKLRGVGERALRESTARQRKKRLKRPRPVTGSSTRSASRRSMRVRSGEATGIRAARGASGISW